MPELDLKIETLEKSLIKYAEVEKRIKPQTRGKTGFIDAHHQHIFYGDVLVGPSSGYIQIAVIVMGVDEPYLFSPDTKHYYPMGYDGIDPEMENPNLFNIKQLTEVGIGALGSDIEIMRDDALSIIREYHASMEGLKTRLHNRLDVLKTNGWVDATRD